jgi:hypothetical protein
MTALELNRNRRQAYVIFSVDIKHDTISYSTRTTGWTKGILILYETFDSIIGAIHNWNNKSRR